ncbi:AAA family ATPase [Candidatus Woesebacteria bacterium]|nr:AAA family ATPase [Candidatus Woesebacteria bacterium]
MKTSNQQSSAWTTRHRPTTLAELHQVSVRSQLSNYQSLGYFPRVLLFAGPKGTGKTTSARIIGALLNDPQNADAVHKTYFQEKTVKKTVPLVDPDPSTPIVQKILTGNSYVVHELDAASNRGINEVRALKDQVQLAPIEGLISVFILDEVHMLTTPAFNALLKLLEEPPAHTTFILATTELQKIPETIVSRCQIVAFHQASQSELEAALGEVAKREAVKISEECIARLAQLANGSFRDGVKYLQQISVYPEISIDLIESIISPSFGLRIDELLASLLDKDAKKVCELISHLRTESYDEKLFYTQLLERVHQDLLLNYLPVADSKPNHSATINLFLLKEFSQSLPNSANPIPFLALEITCLQIIQRSKSSGKSSNSGTPKTVIKPKPATPNSSPEVEVIESESATAPKRAPLIKTDSVEVGTGNAQALLENWPSFTALIAKTNTTLAALLRSTQPKSAHNSTLEIEVYYQFHKEQLRSTRHLAAIKPAMEEFAGGEVVLNISVVSAPVVANLVDQVPSSLPAQVAAALLQSEADSNIDVVQSNVST